MQSAPLIDPFGRTVDYLRVSVTDRCDLRCVYCMSEHMTFLPRPELLTLEELDRLCSVFVAVGVRRLRLTGGEPLTRRGFMDLVGSLSRHLQSGALEELTLTTNGLRLAEFADDLAAAGVRRINVSVDTVNSARYARLTRGGRLAKVLDGIAAAQAAGLKIKLNAVALRGENEHELAGMVAWAHERNCELTIIETMPVGEVEGDRLDLYLPLTKVRADLSAVWTLTELSDRTSGPARYFRIEETGGRIGFITPLTHNFCESCNRVRLTCTGQLYLCLGQDDHADLRSVMRTGADDGALAEAVRKAITRKPRGHDFDIARRAPAVSRHMSLTGG